jgi:hypothetical protein
LLAPDGDAADRRNGSVWVAGAPRKAIRAAEEVGL